MMANHSRLDLIKQNTMAMAFASPVYNMTLGTSSRIRSLKATPPAPWPGQADQGLKLMEGTYHFAGETIKSNDPIWLPVGASENWVAEFHGFDWLRDLHAVGNDAARRQARFYVSHWIEKNGKWHRKSWAAHIIGARLSNWIGQYDFFCASADDDFRAEVFNSMARQARHLARILPGTKQGMARLVAIKGLIWSACCLPGMDKHLPNALKILRRELERQVMPDGGHISRAPHIQLKTLQHLIDIRAGLRTAHEEIPTILQHSIDRMTPMLRFFMHGDGKLALFNGAQEEDALLIKTVLSQADCKGRPFKSAPHSGFERVANGRSLLIMDCGCPPPRNFDLTAHAGTLSFEFSVGRNRIITNCGAHVAPGSDWHLALACTAAHSTATLKESNSSELLPGGGLGRHPDAVVCERHDTDGATLIEASHNGYQMLCGLTHMRRLYMMQSGNDMRGEDIIEGEQALPYALRFHLHPDVQASVISEGRAALLLLPNKTGWRFTSGSGGLSIEESIYMGQGETPRRSKQLVMSGFHRGGMTRLKWALKEEDTKDKE